MGWVEYTNYPIACKLLATNDVLVLYFPGYKLHFLSKNLLEFSSATYTTNVRKRGITVYGDEAAFKGFLLYTI